MLNDAVLYETRVAHLYPTPDPFHGWPVAKFRTVSCPCRSPRNRSNVVSSDAGYLVDGDATTAHHVKGPQWTRNTFAG